MAGFDPYGRRGKVELLEGGPMMVSTNLSYSIRSPLGESGKRGPSLTFDPEKKGTLPYRKQRRDGHDGEASDPSHTPDDRLRESVHPTSRLYPSIFTTSRFQETIQKSNSIRESPTVFPPGTVGPSISSDPTYRDLLTTTPTPHALGQDGDVEFSAWSRGSGSGPGPRSGLEDREGKFWDGGVERSQSGRFIVSPTSPVSDEEEGHLESQHRTRTKILADEEA